MLLFGTIKLYTSFMVFARPCQVSLEKVKKTLVLYLLFLSDTATGSLQLTNTYVDGINFWSTTFRSFLSTGKVSYFLLYRSIVVVPPHKTLRVNNCTFSDLSLCEISSRNRRKQRRIGVRAFLRNELWVWDSFSVICLKLNLFLSMQCGVFFCTRNSLS